MNDSRGTDLYSDDGDDTCLVSCGPHSTKIDRLNCVRRTHLRTHHPFPLSPPFYSSGAQGEFLQKVLQAAAVADDALPNPARSAIQGAVRRIALVQLRAGQHGVCESPGGGAMEPGERLCVDPRLSPAGPPEPAEEAVPQDQVRILPPLAIPVVRNFQDVSAAGGGPPLAAQRGRHRIPHV
jgi:hypothetical protein